MTSFTESRERRKTWIGAALTLAVVLIGFALGDWQVRRAAEKAAAQAVRDQAALAQPLSVPATPLAVEALDGKRVRVRGRLLTQQTVVIDNRTLKGVAGVHVVTPVELEPGGSWILVLRGWAPSDPADRSSVARWVTQPTADGQTASAGSAFVELEGFAQREIGRGLELPRLRLPWSSDRASGGQGASDASTPALPAPNQRLWTNVDVATYARWSGHTLQPVIVRQTSDANDGLIRQWVQPGDDVARHEAYATQWYALALVAALLWLWRAARGARERRRARRAAPSSSFR